MTKAQDTMLNAILTSAQLPTLPAVASALLELTAREDTPFTAIVDLIAQDLALSAKILKVANSAFYSFPQQITSINQAVSLLGINAVQSLVLGFTFLSLGGQQTKGAFKYEQFWERSLFKATAAKLIAERIPAMKTDEIFTIGLLQDIGHLIFAMTVPARYDHVLNRLDSSPADLSEIALEEELLALPHTTAGVEVARLWNLPPSMLSAIQYHHDPSQVADADRQQSSTVRVAYLADLLTRIFYAHAPERFHQQFRDEAEHLLELDTMDTQAILQTIHQETSKAAQFFDVTISQVRPVAEIIQEANIKLSLLNLSYEEANLELVRAKEELERVKEQLAERNRVLDQLASIDGLTEVNNHRFFQNFLQTELKRAMGNEGSISLILADIDQFKQFNDAHGHQTGDFILKELCRIAKEVIREYDVMARYGGEEFAFVLPDTTSHGAMTVAEKIRGIVAGHDFFDGSEHYRVTVSLGVATIAPAAGNCSQNNFIAMADEALYDAKRNGRNQAVLYTPQKKGRWFS